MTIEAYVSPSKVAERCADLIVSAAAQAGQKRQRLSIVLAGGNTPKTLYALLASDAYRDKLEWQYIDLFWGDERCVPPDHHESNYRMVEDALLAHLAPSAMPAVYRMEGELHPTQAAEAYESLLRTYFAHQKKVAFDLVLLGMGEDGHTASLFPGTAAIFEQERFVVAHYVDKLTAYRLTLTPAILNRSKQIVFLICGANKHEALQQVWSPAFQPEKFPAQIIRPADGNLLWLVDHAAAGI